MLIDIALVEFCSGAVLVEFSRGENCHETGNYSLNSLRFLKGKSDEERDKINFGGIKNGRLAMIAFTGVIFRKETKLNVTTNCSRNII